MKKEDLMTNVEPMLGGLIGREHLGREAGEYMTRWHLTPWKLWPFKKRLYLHVYQSHDQDAVPHDHPFGFRSIILMGGYTERQYFYEVTPTGSVMVRHHPLSKLKYRDIRRRPLTMFAVPASHVHRIVKLHGKRTVTLLIRGEKEQDWGFFVDDFKKGVVKVVWWEYIGLPGPMKPAY